jgi:hypothetical protein
MPTMASADDMLWARLRELDDPTHMERPADFNEDAADNRFAVLFGLVDAAFECRCTTDAGARIQDASFYGDITVPAEATDTGRDLFIRVSNFGPMATFGSWRMEGDGSWRMEVDEPFAPLARRDADRIETALAGAGYIIVSRAVLTRTYDGRAAPWGAVETWWDRFFAYL